VISKAPAQEKCADRNGRQSGRVTAIGAPFPCAAGLCNRVLYITAQATGSRHSSTHQLQNTAVQGFDHNREASS